VVTFVVTPSPSWFLPSQALQLFPSHQISQSTCPSAPGKPQVAWTVAFLGQSVTRKARSSTRTRPAGSTLHKNEPYSGWEGSSYRIEMQAEPIENWDGEGNPIPSSPYWVSLEDITENDVLPNDLWEAVVGAIDAKCKVEDAERRAAAKARQAKLTPKLKRQH
jgi:hypothetical protein